MKPLQAVVVDCANSIKFQEVKKPALGNLGLSPDNLRASYHWLARQRVTQQCSLFIDFIKDFSSKRNPDWCVCISALPIRDSNLTIDRSVTYASLTTIITRARGSTRTSKISDFDKNQLTSS
jgi:hypothetical protein